MNVKYLINRAVKEYPDKQRLFTMECGRPFENWTGG